MGSAKLKPSHDVAVARQIVDREDPHDGRVAEVVLDMAHDFDDGDPIAGIRNAMIVGVAFWTILAFGALLLV